MYKYGFGTKDSTYRELLSSIMQSAISTLKGEHQFDQTDVVDLLGKTAVVTGGSAGIGFEVAKALAESRARVLVLSRKSERGEEAVRKIREVTSGGVDVEYLEIDLGSAKNVREIADHIRNTEERLDILVCDAGIGVNKYDLTEDGIEHHFGVNNLGHFCLINRLLPLIRKTALLNQAPAPRIVQLSSSLHLTAPSSIQFASLEEINDDSLGANALYARSKLANLLYARFGLAKGVLEKGPGAGRIYALATHPGAVATEQQDQFKDAYGQLFGTLLKTATIPFMRNPEQGSLSTLWAATSPDVEMMNLNGEYITDPGKWGGESDQGKDWQLADNLWKLSTELISQKAGEDALLDWTGVKP
ncbi:NAD-binding protein [Schizopora paradoxa]|uniref:NAD-binding protein n=1 Tax=Schizopora paradoxa TaxID=27342 RepID=A0A0H2RZJ6_9AGAM|nr:NAD-binding protein [Schizopora paradoxa]